MACHRLYLKPSRYVYTLLHHWYREHANKVVKNQSQTPACLELYWQALEISQSVCLDVDLAPHPPSLLPYARVAVLFRR